MVDAPAPIMCKSVPEVVPIGVLHAIRVELTKHISESPANRVTIRFACVNVKIRIVHAVIRMVNIDRLRRDVQITEPNGGHVRIESLPKVSAYLVKPFQLRYILISAYPVFLSQSRLSAPQLRAFRDICACRTAALGSHIEQCDNCSRQTIAYDSCRNRHCPKCQSSAGDKWLLARSAELLPVPYSHVVFTLPGELSELALQNRRIVYNILFRAVSETLLTIAADPRHLGAQLGFLAVLHTWSQKLLHHPHLHCLIPAGGLSPDRSRWVRSRRRFFLPIAVLRKMFRGKFLSLLAAAFRNEQLRFSGRRTHLAAANAFDRFLRQLRGKTWVVYAKRPFGGPEHVIKYLARYTHRVAISNGRLTEIKDHQVTFRWRDSADSNQQKLMTLDAVSFIGRFLLHILPSGFVKIRHFGFMANRRITPDEH